MGILGKRFPTPVARPMAPFFIASLIVIYGINSFGEMLKETDEWKYDARNPNPPKGDRIGEKGATTQAP